MPLNTGLWTTWGAGSTFTLNGTLRLQVTGTSGEYAGVYSNSTYDFTDKTLQAQIALLPNAVAGVQLYLRAEIDASNSVIIGYSDTGTLFMQHQIAGVTTTVDSEAWPAGTIGLKLVFDNAQSLLWFATTPDGITWTSRFSEAIPIATTALRVVLGYGCYQFVGGPGPAGWESVGLPVVIYKSLTGTTAGTSTASGTISVVRYKNLTISATYPPGGSTATSALLGKNTEIQRPPYICQIATAQVYDSSTEIIIPIKPLTPTSQLYVVIFTGAVTGHANVGSPQVLSPILRKAGVTITTGNISLIGLGPSGTRTVSAGYVYTPSSGGLGWGLGMDVRVPITGGTFGDTQAVVVEILGISGSPFGQSVATLTGTSTTPGISQVPTMRDNSVFMGIVLTTHTVDGTTFTQTGMPGKTWTRVFESTSGTIHNTFAVDLMIGYDNLGPPGTSFNSTWTTPTSGTWEVLQQFWRGGSLALAGTATGYGWAPRLGSSGTPKYFTSTIISGQSNGQATCVGSITARPITVVLGGPTDTFSTGTLDPQWTYSGTGLTQDVLGGTLNLGAQDNVIGSAPAVVSAATDMRGKTLQVEFVQRATTATTNSRAGIRLTDSAGTTSLYSYDSSGTNLIAWEGGTNVNSLPWPVGLRAIRMVFEAPLLDFPTRCRVYYQYTLDGVHWITQGTRNSTGITLVQLATAKVFIHHSTILTGVVSPGTAKYDNVNVTPFPWVVYKSLTGTSNGAATEAGQVDKAPSRKDIVGLAVGATTVSVLFAARRSLTASSAGVSSVAVTLQRKRSLTVSSAGTSTANAALQPKRSLTASSAGVATVSQILTRLRNLVVTSAGVASVTVALRTTRALTGTSNASAVANSAVFIPFGPTDPYGLAVYNNVNNIAYWRLNDASGTIAVDSSKIGGHNATYVGQGAGAYNTTVLATSGLVAYWHLDETSGTVGNDSKGIAHGVYQGTPILGQSGIPNNTTSSVKFGPSNYLRIPYASPATDPLRLANGPLTVEAWIKRNALNGQNNGIISTGTDGYYLRINNSNQLQFLRSQIQGIAVSSTTIADTTTWHHVAATKSGATTKLFLDGVELVATVTDATLANSTFPYFYVGAELNGTETFDGWMDEVAVYNVALSPAQIADHYAKGSSSPSGLGYPGAISGTTDKSVNFDGVDDYIEVPDFVMPSSGAVEAWVKADVWGASSCVINRRTVGNIGGFSLEINSGVPYFHVHNGTAWQGIAGTRTLQVGVWHHVAGIYVPGQSLLMVDGEDCGRLSWSGTINNPASPLFRIGFNNAGSQLVDGQIDEVAIYNYAMPDQTTRDHYHLGVKPLDAYGLAVDRTPGLISFSRLEEPLGSVSDSTGNGHTGTVGTGVAYGVTGALFTGDKGLTLNGTTNAYVDLSDVGSTLDIAGDLTLECWLKVANYANYWMMIINSDAPALRSLYEYRTELTSGLPSLLQANGTAWQFTTATSPAIPPPLNQWNHMVVTRQGNTVQHYLNGVANGPALTLTGAVPLAPATNPVKLGARLDSGVVSYPLVGSLDEVAIYNRALTLTEVQEHYNKGISGTWKVSVVGTSPGASTVSVQLTRRRSLTVTSAGISTATATPKARRSLTVTSVGVAVSSAQATRRRSVVVAAAGVSTATGDIGKAIQFRNMVGTSVGIAADIGQTTVRKLLTGTSVAISTAAGQSTRRRSLVVASAGTATETGQPSARRSLVVASSGQTTVSVALTKYKISLVGLAPGVATASATTIQRKKSITGVSAGVTTEVGQPTGRRSMVVASAGTSVSSGQTTRRKAMVVASAGVAIATAQIIRKASIVVSAAGKATATGQILIRSATVPPVTIGGVATVSGFIGRKRQITAASAGKATNTAVATRKRALLATSAGVAVTGVTIQRKRPLTASITGIATTTVTAIQRYHALPASVANGIATTPTAFVSRKRQLSGVSICSSGTNRATISGKRAIVANSNGKALTFGRPINITLILWNGSTFVLAGSYPVVLWDQQEFELQPEEGEENVDYVAYKGSTDQFNAVDV